MREETRSVGRGAGLSQDEPTALRETIQSQTLFHKLMASLIHRVVTNCVRPHESPFHSNLCCARVTMSCDSSESQLSLGALGPRDQGRPLGLATAAGRRVGRQPPSQPPLLLARQERPSVLGRRSRAQQQRARKLARAFWWSSRAATTTPSGLNAMHETEVGMNTTANEDIDHDTMWLSSLSEDRQPGTPAPNCSMKDCYGHCAQNVSTKRVGDRTANWKVCTFDSKAAGDDVLMQSLLVQFGISQCLLLNAGHLGKL